MTTDTCFQHQLARLHANYSEMYDQAKGQLRKRPLLLAALYLKDAVRIGLTSLSGAALCVPIFWFWAAVSDLGSIQQAMAEPIDSGAVWVQAGSFFVLLFSISLGWAICRGDFGRSHSARLHADTQLLFTQAVAQSVKDRLDKQACPICSGNRPPQ